MKNLITITSLVAAAAMTTTAFGAGDANTIFVNFASSDDNKITSDTVNGTWNNFTSASSTDSQSLVSSDGNNFSGTLTYSSANTWSESGNTDTVLKGYLDDGGSGITINVTGLSSYLCYNVKIISATDTGNCPFSAKTVNGVTYYGVDGVGTVGSSAWGNSDTGTVGNDNSFTVSNLMGDLSISSVRADANGQTVRGCVAGLVVEVYSGTAVEITASGTQIDWTDSQIGSGTTWTNSTSNAGTYAAFALTSDTAVNVTGTITTDAITASGSGTLTLSGNAISLIGPSIVRTDSDTANIAINNTLNFSSSGMISGNITFGSGAQVNFANGGTIMGNVTFNAGSALNVVDGALAFAGDGDKVISGTFSGAETLSHTGSGTLTFSGQNMTIGTLISSATTNFSGTTSITTANITGGAAKFSGTTSITTANITGGATTFSGTSTIGTLNHQNNGTTLTFASGSNTTVDSYFGSAGGDGKNITTTIAGVLNVTGNKTGPGNPQETGSFMMANGGGTNTITIENGGVLNLKNTTLSNRDGTGILNVETGGEANFGKGLHMLTGNGDWGGQLSTSTAARSMSVRAELGRVLRRTEKPMSR